MKIIQLKLILHFLYILFLLTGCKVEKTENKKQNVLSLPAVKVVTRDVITYKEYPARISGTVEVDIRPKISGYIDKVHVEEGDFVKKDDLLFSLETTNLDNQLAAAEARLLESKIELNKTNLLVENNLVSQVQQETALARYKIALSDLGDLKATMQYAQVRSPISGFVGDINFKEGSLVGPDDTVPLTELASVKDIEARFALNEKEILSLQKYDRFNKTNSFPFSQIKLILADGQEYEYTGFVESISGAVNPLTGTVSVKAIFPNPNSILYNGGSAKILIPKKFPNALVIPASASFEIQNKRFVFLIQPDSTVKQIEIKPVMNIDNLLIIKNDLVSDDIIVAQGMQKVNPQIKVAAQLKPISSFLNSFTTVFK